MDREQDDWLCDGSIVPDQIGERALPASGPRALLAAVLEEAIVSLLGGGKASAEAAAWFTSPERRGVFAFEPLCEALDLDPVALRRAVLACQRRAAAEGAASTSVRRRIPRMLRADSSRS